MYTAFTSLKHAKETWQADNTLCIKPRKTNSSLNLWHGQGDLVTKILHSPLNGKYKKHIKMAHATNGQTLANHMLILSC